VPVTYTDVQGGQLSSNQYSVTEHFKHAYDGFPAVYIMCALLTAIPNCRTRVTALLCKLVVSVLHHQLAAAFLSRAPVGTTCPPCASQSRRFVPPLQAL
jgi:hypothetical protein